MQKLISRSNVFRAALLGAGSLALGACGSTHNGLLTLDYPIDPSGGARTTAAGSPQQVASAPPATYPQTTATPLPQGQGEYKVGRPYQIGGQRYTPAEDPSYDAVGIASWYGDAFHGKPTANGETFDMNMISAAHTTLPLPSIVEVTNLENGRTMQVRVNDRGPFVNDRIIDLSRAAAAELGMLNAGLARVRVRYVGPASLDSGNIIMASAEPQREYQRVAAEPMPPLPPLVLPPRQFAAPPASQVASQYANYSVTNNTLPATAADQPWAVQAGLYQDLTSAERAAGMVGSAGQTEIRLTQQLGQTFYQVVIGYLPDERAAASVHSQIVAGGFDRARILRP
jgi:rare lipoprotein A